MLVRLLVPGGVIAGVLGALWFSTAVTALGRAPGNVQGIGKSQPAQQQWNTGQSNPQTTSREEDQKPHRTEAECRNYKQNYYDCIIQLRTARATERQARVALIGAIIAGVTLLVAGIAAGGAIWAAVEARRTARAAIAATKVSQASLRQAAKLGREQTRVAEMSSKASVRSADVAEHALRGLERPYLFIEIENTNSLKVRHHAKPSLYYSLVNYGKLPAIMRSFSISLRDNPTFPLRSTEAVADTSYAVVQPGKCLPSSRPGGTDWHTLEVANAEPGQDYSGAKATLLILHALIEYDDPTGAHHTDSICMRGAPGANTFSIDASVEEFNSHESHYPKKKTHDSEGS